MNKISLSSQKQKRVKKAFGNGIEVYNLTKEEEAEIINFLSKFANEDDVNIKGEDILIHLLPICSNIYIDTEDEQLVKDIIADPSDELESVVEIIGEIITKLSGKVAKANEVIATLNPAQVAKLLGIEELITDDEMEELKRLEEKAKRSGIK